MKQLLLLLIFIIGTQLLLENNLLAQKSAQTSKASSEVAATSDDAVEPVDTGVEELYDKFEDQENKQQSQKKEEVKAKEESDKVAEKEINKISDLSNLAPFDDVAVIQKRFLPKTGRTEFSTSAVISTNNQYFNNVGLGFRVAYHLQEKYALEATYLMMTSTERPITKGLIDNQQIQTQSLVEPQSFYGLSFKWTPLYGKVALFQQKIIPFDIYFTPGFGVTSTQAGGSEATITLGTGQIFALTKSLAARWDFVWNYYQPKVTVDGVSQTRNQSDIFIGVGVCYFIPEATYR